MEKWLEIIHRMVWGPWTLVLFLGTGVWFTLRSGIFQIRGFPVWWSSTAGSMWKQDKKAQRRSGCSQFQSACTALAATIGTGNIVGVATALTAGGPGALFWMWLSAGIGMMTAYAETWLGQVYRYRRDDGHWMCGPMIYMEHGLGVPVLGNLYAFLVVMASLGMGSMVQANSMSETIRSHSVRFSENGASVSAVLIGVAAVLLTGTVIRGGIARISRVSEYLVPISAGIYLIFSAAVIVSCWNVLPEIAASVFRGAWTPSAAGGGAVGFFLSRSVRYGLSRGVFSNEAGLGTLAVLHGAAEDTTPERQGMWAMFEVFFDTIVICTLTAFVILCISCREQPPAGADGAALTAWCFSRKLGGFGEILVSGAMIVFAFATIIAWYYLGRQAAEYLLERATDGQNREKIGIRFYTVLYLAAVFTGCISRLEIVWLISDIWNGLMVYPNLLALWFLASEVKIPLDIWFKTEYTGNGNKGE